MGGIADSGVVLRLTRSRLWIGVLGSLLVGIVGLNVLALSFNATASKTAGISDQLRRENSALRAQIAGGLSNERLQNAAVRLGLVVPEPGAIRYLDPSPEDAANAAKRLRNGAFTVGSAYVPPVAPVTPVVPVTDTPVPPAEPAAPADPTVPTETVAPETAAAAPPPATAGGITP